MGIENLQNAARAAGFAMVASDEPLTEAKREIEQTWLPKAALLDAGASRDRTEVAVTTEKAQAFGEWVKTMLASTGRAPA